MTLAICRAVAHFLPQPNQLFNRLRIPFRAPTLPLAHPLNHWTWQQRHFGFTSHLHFEPPFKIVNPAQKYFLTPNKLFMLGTHLFQIHEDRTQAMAAILEFLQTSDFEGIVIEEKALIGNHKWISDLLSHIARSGPTEIRIIIQGEPFNSSASVVQLNLPTESQVEQITSYLLNKKPEALEISLKHLTPKMIEKLSYLISRASFAHSFEITRNSD